MNHANNHDDGTLESRSMRLALELSPCLAASSPRLVNSSCRCCNASMTVRGSGALTRKKTRQNLARFPQFIRTW